MYWVYLVQLYLARLPPTPPLPSPQTRMATVAVARTATSLRLTDPYRFAPRHSRRGRSRTLKLLLFIIILFKLLAAWLN